MTLDSHISRGSTPNGYAGLRGTRWSPVRRAGNGDGIHIPPQRLELLSGYTAPRDLHAERCVLGAVLLDPAAIVRVAQRLKESAFYDDRHKAVYAACLAIHARGEVIDLVTVERELARTGAYSQTGWGTLLADLTYEVASAANMEAHARSVLEQARLRQLQRTCSETLARIGQGGECAADLVASLDERTRVLRLTDPRQSNPLLQGEGSVEELLITEFLPEPAWVEKLIYPGGACFIVGPPGIGKTTLAFHLIVSLASGSPFFVLATTRCNVGLLALETPGLYAKRKMERLLGGAHPPEWAKRVFIRGRGFPPRFPSRWDLLDPKAHAQIIEWLLAKQIQVLVLDPFVHFHTEEENDNGDMNRVMAACDDIKDQTGVALAFLHHPGKGESGAGQKGRGASVPYGYADAELTMTRTKDSRIKVEWTKPPRNDPAPPPFHLLMTPEGILELAEAEAAKDTCEAEDLPAKKATVVSTLRTFGKPMMLGDLREALLGQEVAVPASTLHRWLGQLEAAGSVRPLGDGSYEAI